MTLVTNKVAPDICIWIPLATVTLVTISTPAPFLRATARITVVVWCPAPSAVG
jgi:hypothetical protein